MRLHASLASAFLNLPKSVICVPEVPFGPIYGTFVHTQEYSFLQEMDNKLEQTAINKIYFFMTIRFVLNIANV